MELASWSHFNLFEWADQSPPFVLVAVLRRYKIEDKMSYEDLRDHQIDEAWREFNRWHGQEARRLAAAKAREQLLELCGDDDSDSDDSGSETDSGDYEDQDDPHPSEPKRGTKEGPSGGEAHEEDRSAGSGDMELDELEDLRAQETRDWDAEAERLSIERDQVWENERRQQRQENARLKAALEKSRADNQSLSMSICHMQMVLHGQEVRRKETVKSNPNWLKRLPEPNALLPPKAKRARKDIPGSLAAARKGASSSARAGRLAKDKRESTTKDNGHEVKKRVNKHGVEEPLNWDPRNQCDAAALALKQYREELAMRENERCRRMVTAATVPAVPMQWRWRKSFKAASESGDAESEGGGQSDGK